MVSAGPPARPGRAASASRGSRALAVAILLLLLLPLTAFGEGRIISLSPQITESIYLLGAEQSLVAVTELCLRPKEARRLTRVGTPSRPDIEKIVSMAPSIVLAAREGTPPWYVDRLKRLGIETRYLARPKDLDGLCANFLDLAGIVGRRNEADRIIREMKSRLQPVLKTPVPTVFWQVGAEPLVGASSASLANEIIRWAGGKNIIDTQAPYPRLNREEVVTRRPDVIVLMDMGYNVEAEKGRWRRHLEQVRFLVVDAYAVASPTPESFLKSVEFLKAHLSGAP
jgi:iron complex transport system substrate-binding protein